MISIHYDILPETFESLYQSFTKTEQAKLLPVMNLIRKQQNDEVMQQLPHCMIPGKNYDFFCAYFYYYQDAFEFATQYFNALKLTRNTDQTTLIIAGIAAQKAGYPDLAVKHFKRAYTKKREPYPDLHLFYGNALLENQEYDQAWEIFRSILAARKAYELTMSNLIDVYDNMLEIVCKEDNQELTQHLLDNLIQNLSNQTSMNQEAQQSLASFVAHLSNYRKKQWVYDLFLPFVKQVEDLHLITDATCKKTMESAYTSQESYRYSKDQKLPQAVKDYYFADDDTKFIYLWSLVEYTKSHTHYIAYIQKQYPQLYQMLLPHLERIKQDSDRYQQELAERIFLTTGAKEIIPGTIVKKHHKETQPKMPQQKKIGPNDPCPCGSGKKHKKCCKFKKT